MITAVGIDPGKTGFIVAINMAITGETWSIASFDKYPIPLWNGEIDLVELSTIMSEFKDIVCNIALEHIHSFPGTGKGTMFVMGRVLGNIEMALACNGLEFSLIRPKTWQNAIWQPEHTIYKDNKVDTKATSIACAQALYPDFDLRKSDRAKVPNHNVADALLLAEYARTQMSWNIRL